MSTVSDPGVGPKPVVVGLTGFKRSGKDTFGQFLVDSIEQAGGKAVLIGMSDDLADCLRVLNPHIRLSPEGKRHWGGREYVPYQTLLADGGYEKAKEEPEVRALLQRMGTDVMRDIIAEDTWGRLLHAKIFKALVHGTSVIVTGVRYPSDAEVIQVNGGIVVEVRRAAYGEEVENLDSHSSEQGLPADLIDEIVHNDRDLEALKGKASLFHHWLQRRTSPVRPS